MALVFAPYPHTVAFPMAGCAVPVSAHVRQKLPLKLPDTISFRHALAPQASAGECRDAAFHVHLT